MRRFRKVYRRCSYNFSNKKRCSLGVLAYKNLKVVQCALHREVIRRNRVKPNEKLIIYNKLRKYLKPQLEAEHVAGYASVADLATINKKCKIRPHIKQVEDILVTQQAVHSTDAVFDDWDSTDAEESTSDDDDEGEGGRTLTETEVVRKNLQHLEKLLQNYQIEKTYMENLYKRLDVVHGVTVKELKNDMPLTEMEETQLDVWRKYTHKHELTALVQSQDAEWLDSILREYSYEDDESEVPDDSGYRCVYTDGAIKCAKVAFGPTQYCKRHLAYDAEQLLFRKCGRQINDESCDEPVLNVDDESTCILHELTDLGVSPI